MLTIVSVVAPTALFGPGPQPSAGRQDPSGTRKTACGCYVCGKLLAVNFEEPSGNCAGILATDACGEQLENMPQEKVERFCQRIKARQNFTSFKDSCVDFAPYCEPEKSKDKCQPDKGALCTSVGQAARLIKEARSPAGSTQIYQTLQQSLGPLLDKIREELCDDPAAQEKVNQLQNELDSLNFVSGQSNVQNNLRLVRLEDGIKGLATASCSVGGSPTAPNRRPCAAGEKEVAPGDDEAAKSVTDGINAAIDELKNTAEELEGQGGDSARKIEDIKGKLAKYEQMKGFWENIKAGSCVPADVLQTMKQVANDRRSDNYSNNCPAMCSALADWFVKINPGPQPGPQRKLFIERCLADCN
jgi:hypothetical protein